MNHSNQTEPPMPPSDGCHFNVPPAVDDHSTPELRPDSVLTSSNLEQSVASQREDFSTIIESSKSDYEAAIGDRRLVDSTHLHWWKPLYWMFGLIILALSFAIAHHCFNSSLSEKPVTAFSQTWSHNLGTGAAFGVKTACHLAIALACQEVLWYSMRKRGIRISTLDDMFTLLSNPLSFTPAAWRNAWLLSLLALSAWLVPLAAILSPGTLTVGPHVSRSNKTCLVPSYPGHSARLFAKLTQTFELVEPDTIVNSIAAQTFPLASIMRFPSPCGADCAYNQMFYGPALRCHPISDNPGYYGYYEGQDAIGEIGLHGGFLYNTTYEFPLHVTLKYKYITASTTVQGALSDLPEIYLNCSAYNASYDLRVAFKAGIPTFQAQLEYTHSINYQLGLTDKPPIADNPPLMNSHALVQEVFNWVNGNVAWGKNSMESTTKIGETSLAKTSLSGSPPWQVQRDFSIAVPELLTNLTISTLSLNASNETTLCMIITEYQAYQYDPLWLVLPYALTLLASLVAVAVAFYVLKKSGFRTGRVFSQILVTTRNPEIDRLTFGNSLSSVTSRRELKDCKLRFGRVLEPDHGTHGIEGSGPYAAFGCSDAVTKIKKNMTYI